MAKTYPCPTCSGVVLVNNYKQTEETYEGWFGCAGFAARLPLIGGLIDAVTGMVRPKKSLFDKDCPTCGGDGTVEDKADRTSQMIKAAELAKKESDSILKLEAKLGPMGGNRHTIVVGDEMLEVGLGFNDSKSYKIIKDGQLSPSGGKIEAKATLPVYRKSPSVLGTNPLSTPGGHYHIKCSNKFSVFAGAQGVNIDTNGPVTIKGGITQIVGPEVTIGSSVGRVVVEGDHLQLNGNSIALTPSPSSGGQVAIQGTLHTSGNAVIGGGIHTDGDLSFNSATCPGRLERTRVSSDTNQVTGPAQWSANCTTMALMDFVRKVAISIADPTSLLLSPRGIQNMQHDMISLLKKSLPLETLPTGIITSGTPVSFTVATVIGPITITGGTFLGTVAAPIPFYNFPHHHTLADGAHCHDSLVPNIKLLTSTEEVRKNSKSKESIAPASITEPGGSNIFLRMGQGILSILSIKISP